MGELLSKFDYGTPENLISTKLSQWDKCPRKQFHDRYVPLQDFTKEHLPVGFQTEPLFELTMLLADLTVLIKGDYTSIERKDKKWQKTSMPYPCSNMAGKGNVTNGTGRIWDVFHRSERKEFTDVTCPCPKCVNEANTSNNVWIIKVYTATHVVFDSSEAKQSKCILFYNSDSEKSSEKTIYGLQTIWKHEQGDLCILFCVTCDEELKDNLNRKNYRLQEIWDSYDAKSKDKLEENRLAITVSHPHGCPKRVSAGLWQRRVKIFPYIGEHRFTYSLSTCSGSSGAPVFILGSDFLHSAYCHCGSSGDCSYSYSTRWLNKRKMSCVK